MTTGEEELVLKVCNCLLTDKYNGKFHNKKVEGMNFINFLAKYFTPYLKNARL